ncbi:alpha/beta hydrolase [Sphingobium sp. CAP-1]|uniref:alpha/beta hydrolase n=1 Tax=Sphingobium sp. CAP-1 TaxID=2676077 RepID=UPI0012BB26FF|nr:alpha/beta hydrolase [Sphingobium sp. CAP-1]QGP79834.1 alpha/beta hydrolase fold domain-containing protein [Sphingobium sp. CAP-1]
MEQDFVRPDVAAFLAQIADSGAPPLPSLPVEQARAGMRDNGAMGDLPPVPLARIIDLRVDGGNGSRPARFYDRRAARSGGDIILFYHGGGFVMGDLDTHHAFCTWLADRLDRPVLAIDYRLAPEHPYPAAVDDAEAAARWVAAHMVAGLEADGLILCGDSAGGNLAIAVSQALALRPAATPVRAIWAIYPYIGDKRDWPSVARFADGFLIGKADMQWFDALYAAPDEARHNLLLGTPAPAPHLILTAGLDPLRDQGQAYAAHARQSGAPVRDLVAEGMIHGFVTLRGAMPSAVEDCEAFAQAAIATLP